MNPDIANAVQALLEARRSGRDPRDGAYALPPGGQLPDGVGSGLRR